MKRGPAWSQGILLVMLGITVATLGLLKATMLPSRSGADWYVVLGGAGISVVGAVIARRAAKPLGGDTSDRLPRARLRRR
ncbi:MAG: hypothetical protein SFX73_40315 [Kofleriaceae bacterium]|nr:hypothetical protein [Kofleriaceae bacterium]